MPVRHDRSNNRALAVAAGARYSRGMTRITRSPLRPRPPRLWRTLRCAFAMAARGLRGVAEFWPPARSFLQ
jgi:hypothetical protein